MTFSLTRIAAIAAEILPKNWGGGEGPTQTNTNAPIKFQIRIRIFSYFLQIVVKIVIRRGEDNTFSLLIFN